MGFASRIGFLGWVFLRFSLELLIAYQQSDCPPE
ncbi:hypothetical protein LYNGBM3L_59010 [Moorena producens 3L]|uniref:Uncharacterized protein n=1 Tax=Moorena producens 3L TaxID=489825 RepID=F4XZV2_9CYAN|nr:hypothetical protein LYNGBM3L_59010 [Moorena producens 3L]